MKEGNVIEEEVKFNYLNLLVIILSVYVLVELFLSAILKFPPETERLLEYIDNGICVFFLFEFSIRFYKAESKLKFMKWGWIDLVSSIPTLDYFRAGRALRLIRLLRILRVFRSSRHLFQHFTKRKSQSALATVSIIAVLMIIFSTIAILQVENDPNSNIKTAEDAIWWSYVTITTVGYGDKFPVTTEGRLIAAALMTVGVGLFGTFTGFLASWFVADKKSKNS